MRRDLDLSKNVFFTGDSSAQRRGSRPKHLSPRASLHLTFEGTSNSQLPLKGVWGEFLSHWLYCKIITVGYTGRQMRAFHFHIMNWSLRSDWPEVSHLEIFPGLSVLFPKLNFPNIFVEEIFKGNTNSFSGVSFIHLITLFPSHTHSWQLSVLLCFKKSFQSIRLPYGH